MTSEIPANTYTCWMCEECFTDRDSLERHYGEMVIFNDSGNAVSPLASLYLSSSSVIKEHTRHFWSNQISKSGLSSKLSFQYEQVLLKRYNLKS